MHELFKLSNCFDLNLQVDYNSETDVKDDYTSRRTSKVTYRSEVALPNPLEKWSRRIETAAKLGEIIFSINRWR